MTNTDKIRDEFIAELNDYQKESLIDALNTSDEWVGIYRQELEKFTQGNKEYDTHPLIEKIIIPFNVRLLTTDITDRIEKGSWTVMYVSGGEEEPAFAYTIGLTQHIGRELMVSNIPQGTAGFVINSVADQLIEGIDEDAIELPVTPDRYRMVNIPLNKGCGEMPLTVKQYCTVEDRHQLTVILLADAEGVLPGENGYNEDFQQFYANGRRL